MISQPTCSLKQYSETTSYVPSTVFLLYFYTLVLDNILQVLLLAFTLHEDTRYTETVV